MKRDLLLEYLGQLLTPERYSDYAPNGLQVEGVDEVRRVVSGVTACQALVDTAVARGADTLLVHHGYFWRGEAQPVVGMKARRLRTLLMHGINLIAYHLPLDVHPELGNNAAIARDLEIEVLGRFDTGTAIPLGWHGALRQPLAAEAFVRRVGESLGRTPTLVSGGDHPIRTIGWCTGGAQGFIDGAAALGLDAYLSGELSEPTVHVAREAGIHYLAAGHHATERGGVRDLGRHLAERFGIEVVFVDIDSPA